MFRHIHGYEGRRDEISSISRKKLSRSQTNKTRKNPLLSLNCYGFSLFSVICYSLGAAGIIFILFTVLSGRASTGTGKLGDDTGRVLAGRPLVLGVVGVQTSFRSADHRAALRSTWFPSTTEEHHRLQQRTNLVFKFVIGRTNDAEEMAQVVKENNEYNDFMFIDIEDDFLKRPYKTLAFFKEALELFDAEYYVKADDDIYLRPDRLAPLLTTERTDRLNYIGCMNKEHYGRNEEVLYAQGQIYILSAEVVKSLAQAKNDSLTMSKYEDVSVGFWMLAMGVQHEDIRTLCDPQCTPTSIAVWDISICSDQDRLIILLCRMTRRNSLGLDVVRATFCACVYHIWSGQNSRVYGNDTAMEEKIIQKIFVDVEEKILIHSKHVNSCEHSTFA